MPLIIIIYSFRAIKILKILYCSLRYCVYTSAVRQYEGGEDRFCIRLSYMLWRLWITPKSMECPLKLKVLKLDKNGLKFDSWERYWWSDKAPPSFSSVQICCLSMSLQRNTLGRMPLSCARSPKVIPSPTLAQINNEQILVDMLCLAAATLYLLLYLCLFPAVCPHTLVRERHTQREGERVSVWTVLLRFL